MRPWLLALLVGCAAKGDPSDPTGVTGETPTGETSDTTSDPGTPDTGTPPDPTTPTAALHGTLPPEALPAPEFASVVNQDVQIRSRADLLGHPTVLWFYPAAETGG